VGVQELAHLTSLSKQAASRILVDLAAKGLVEKASGDLDGRRRTASLTGQGEAFEARSASGCAPRSHAPIAPRAGWRSGNRADPGRAGRRADPQPRGRRRMTDDPQPDRADGAHRHLLIVDDDDRIRELLKEYLARRAFG
jgi:DNA-binding MarR family transcriptional regulator